MNKIMIIWLTVMGFCAAVFFTPREFWIDTEPDYFSCFVAVLLFCAGLAFWIYHAISNARDEAAVALTAYINYKLTDEQRSELAEPDPWYEQNSGYMRWKKDAGQSRWAYLMSIWHLQYADL